MCVPDRNMRLLRQVSYHRKKIQANLREPWRIIADNDGHVITFVPGYIRKWLMLKYLEARGVEPLFPTPTSTKVQKSVTAAPVLPRSLFYRIAQT